MYIDVKTALKEWYLHSNLYSSITDTEIQMYIQICFQQFVEVYYSSRMLKQQLVMIFWQVMGISQLGVATRDTTVCRVALVSTWVATPKCLVCSQVHMIDLKYPMFW